MKMFSVVICTYNGAKNIEKVLDSILNCREIDTLVEEILVVDNASTDNLASTVHSYINRHPLVKYCYESNSGLSNARKRALDCSGEWIIYFDDDNLPCEHWLTESKQYISKNPNIGVFGGRNIACVQDELTEEQRLYLQCLKGNLACHYESYDDYSKKRNCSAKESVFGAGMTIKKSILSKLLESGWTKGLGRTGQNLGAYEDTEIILFALSSGYEMGILDEVYLYHLIPKGGWTKGLGRTGQNLGAYEDTEIILFALSSGYEMGILDEVYLYHLIPKGRLEKEYLLRLRKGMDDSELFAVVNGMNPIKNRCKLFLKDALKLLKYSAIYLTTSRKDKTFAYFMVISCMHKVRCFPAQVIDLLKATR